MITKLLHTQNQHPLDLKDFSRKHVLPRQNSSDIGALFSSTTAYAGIHLQKRLPKSHCREAYIEAEIATIRGNQPSIAQKTWQVNQKFVTSFHVLITSFYLISTEMIMNTNYYISSLREHNQQRPRPPDA